MCPKLFKIVIFCICMHIFGLRCFVFTFYIEFLHILMYKGRFWLIRVRSRRSSGQKSGPFFYLVEYFPPLVLPNVQAIGKRGFIIKGESRIQLALLRNDRFRASFITFSCPDIHRPIIKTKCKYFNCGSSSLSH